MIITSMKDLDSIILRYIDYDLQINYSNNISVIEESLDQKLDWRANPRDESVPIRYAIPHNGRCIIVDELPEWFFEMNIEKIDWIAPSECVPFIKQLKKRELLTLLSQRAPRSEHSEASTAK